MVVSALVRQWTSRIFTTTTKLRQIYESFRELLEADGEAHDLMAELSMLRHGVVRMDPVAVARLYERFSAAVTRMVVQYRRLQPVDGALIGQYLRKIDFYTRFLLAPPEELPVEPLVLDLDDCGDVRLCGNKAVNLARLGREIDAPVPPGFVVTGNGFHRFLYKNGLRPRINDLLARIDLEDREGLREISSALTALILESPVPGELVEAMQTRAEALCRTGGQDLLAVRSSALAEDGEHSFAGQYASVLAVPAPEVVRAWQEVVASKYSPRALTYRIKLGLADEETSMAVLVLPMVAARVSGVMYSRDPRHPDLVAVHAVRGLGEVLVGGRGCGLSGRMRRDGLEGLLVTAGLQEERCVLTESGLARRRLDHRKTEWITGEQWRELGRWALKIEDCFGAPQDIEWALDERGGLVILQARPLLSDAGEESPAAVPLTPDPGKVLLADGVCAAPGLVSGVVINEAQLGKPNQPCDGILVTGSTPPSLVEWVGKLRGVVAEQGSVAGHFSTVCREFGIPLLVQAGSAVRRLVPGQEVTLDAGACKVYPGRLPAGKTEKPARVSPGCRRMRPVLDFITPLALTDPARENFRPESCRSMHDIIRYVHEQAVRSMFSAGSRSGGRRTRLESDLPLVVHLLDVGDGLRSRGEERDRVGLEEVRCRPFLALWKGLSHPGIDWRSRCHFDWKSFDDLAMAGGLARPGSDFSSWAVISRDYLNLNMRFGYHFTLVDSLWSGESRTSYCQLRFAGGGGECSGRLLRIRFVALVLERLGFSVQSRADLLEARLAEVGEEELERGVELLGRLLGATKLLDMVLRREEEVDDLVRRFFAGEYTLGAWMQERGKE